MLQRRKHLKAAINANIAKLNEGIKFGDGTKQNNFI